MAKKKLEPQPSLIPTVIPPKENKSDKKGVPRTELYEMFRTWLELPSMFKGKNETDLIEKVGIDDVMILELLQHRTQNDFAAFYDVDIGTLSVWKRKMRADGYDPMFGIRKWSQTLMKNIVTATYNSGMSKDPKANADRKLFMQLTGWVEKSAVEHQAPQTLMDLLKQKIDDDDRLAKKNNRKA
ncbi:hypothetical protein UFOVP594_35 [uncultured Caudovirales phage]|uniref:Uncharacterized protein n=1 Tax=uncultured Caudovirales phage TaxID=2100421 RepID=A0A6J5N127_9CAUD|nr:hypothetical protein UFOVP594_35 [uncultured Caudovirales phage]